MRRYVIAGNGIAGTTAARAIRDSGPEGRIDIYTDERLPMYSRPRLPELIAGSAQERDILIYPEQWYAGRRIGLHLQNGLTSIDASAGTATAASGASIPYDVLLLANGSRCFVPPIPGADKRNVFTLRSVDDAEAIRAAALSRERAVVVGGGLLGIEAGNGLRLLGLKVTIVEVFPRLLPRQLDTAGADMLQRRLESLGFEFRLDAKCRAMVGEDTAHTLMLESGEGLACGLVLVSAGVRPCLELARTAGVNVARGVVVDDRMAASVPGIYAAGDVAEHRGVVYGIWPAAQQQGAVAGANIAGGQATYEGTVPATSLKVAGIDLVSVGDIDADGKKQAIVHQDDQALTYRKLVFDDDRLAGAILLGDSKGGWEIQGAIARHKDVSPLLDELHDPAFDLRRLR